MMKKPKISMFYTDLEDTSDFVLYDNSTVLHGFYKRNSLPEHYRITITSVVVILILFTTLGNLATVVAVRKDRRLRSVSNFYIASLAVADLLVGVFVMTFMLLYTITFDGVWIFGHAFCDIWNFMDYMSCTASLTNVCIIAIDRYQTVSQPLQSIRKRTTRRAMKMISMAWLLPAVFWLVVIVVLRLINGHPPEGHCYIKWSPDYTALLAACISVYLPITLTITLFFTIMSTLKRHTAAMSDRMLREGSVRLDDNVEDTQPTMAPCHMDATGLVTYRDSHVTMIRIHQNTMADIIEMDGHLSGALFVSEACQTGEDEIFMSKNGTELRSVGTSTSPERYGLVRNVFTNTSPSLARRAPFNVEASKQCRSSYSSLNTLDSDSHSGSDSEGHDRSSGSESTASRDLLSDSDLPMTPYPPWRRRYASLLRERRESSVERSRFRQQWRAAKTLGLIMVCLLLCWLPFAIMWPLKTFCPQCVRQRIFDISVWTNYLNSSINPFIYCIYNPHFRRAYKKILMRR